MNQREKENLAASRSKARIEINNNFIAQLFSVHPRLVVQIVCHPLEYLLQKKNRIFAC